MRHGAEPQVYRGELILAMISWVEAAEKQCALQAADPARRGPEDDEEPESEIPLLKAA